MKKWLRKWLGVESLDEKVDEICKKIDLELRIIPSDQELRHMVGKAVEDAFNGNPEKWGFTIEMKNKLHQALEMAAIKPASKIVQHEIKQRIGTEEFIDSVVERIKRKQINS